MNYVYSTLTCSTNYAIYEKTNDLPKLVKKILIVGGKGVATKNLYTPKGIVTEVSDEDLELLEKHYSFIEHKENGFILVEKKNVNLEKVVANMAEKDASAPLTPKDYEKPSDEAPPKTFKPKVKKQ